MLSDSFRHIQGMEGLMLREGDQVPGKGVYVYLRIH